MRILRKAFEGIVMLYLASLLVAFLQNPSGDPNRIARSAIQTLPSLLGNPISQSTLLLPILGVIASAIAYAVADAVKSIFKGVAAGLAVLFVFILLNPNMSVGEVIRFGRGLLGA